MSNVTIKMDDKELVNIIKYSLENICGDEDFLVSLCETKEIREYVLNLILTDPVIKKSILKVIRSRDVIEEIIFEADLLTKQNKLYNKVIKNLSDDASKEIETILSDKNSKQYKAIKKKIIEQCVSKSISKDF